MTGERNDKRRSLSELIALLDRRQYDPACKVTLEGSEYQQLRDAALGTPPSAAPDTAALSALISLEQAYSNKHSPQHRAACLAEARAVIDRIQSPAEETGNG